MILWLVGVATVPTPAWSWGRAAHELVARVAEERLTPAAHEQVRVLLHGAALAAVADWADVIRDQRPETKRWHFVDIPRQHRRYDAQHDCRLKRTGDCAIAAIARMQRVLADRHAAAEARTEALKFLVHLVADLHQPMHCIDDHDGGGNDVRVRFFGKPTNLHAVWDRELVNRRHWTRARYTRALDDWLATQSADALSRGHIDRLGE